MNYEPLDNTRAAAKTVKEGYLNAQTEERKPEYLFYSL
jgi:hypothetical protein